MWWKKSHRDKSTMSEFNLGNELPPFFYHGKCSFILPHLLTGLDDCLISYKMSLSINSDPDLRSIYCALFYFLFFSGVEACTKTFLRYWGQLIYERSLWDKIWAWVCSKHLGSPTFKGEPIIRKLAWSKMSYNSLFQTEDKLRGALRSILKHAKQL